MLVQSVRQFATADFGRRRLRVAFDTCERIVTWPIHLRQAGAAYSAEAEQLSEVCRN